jgi:hypothetical protein
MGYEFYGITQDLETKSYIMVLNEEYIKDHYIVVKHIKKIEKV